MSVLVRIDPVSGIASALLALEFALHGVAMVTRMEAGIAPIEKHLGVRPGAAALTALGLVDFAVSGAFVLGMVSPRAAVLASTYSTGLFGGLMAIRLKRNLGTLTSPPDFPIFLALSAVVLARNVGRV